MVADVKNYQVHYNNGMRNTKNYKWCIQIMLDI